MLSFSRNNPPDEFHWEGWWLWGSSPRRLRLLRWDWSLLLLGPCCFFSLFFSFLPSEWLHCRSVVDVLDFVHFHQLNLVIAKKISSSGGQACVCECDAAHWSVCVTQRKWKKNALFAVYFLFCVKDVWRVECRSCALVMSRTQSHDTFRYFCFWLDEDIFLLSSPRLNFDFLCSLFLHLFGLRPLWLLAVLLTSVRTDDVKPAADFFSSFCQMAPPSECLIMLFSNAIVTNRCNAPLVSLRITSWSYMVQWGGCLGQLTRECILLGSFIQVDWKTYWVGHIYTKRQKQIVIIANNHFRLLFSSTFLFLLKTDQYWKLSLRILLQQNKTGLSSSDSPN